MSTDTSYETAIFGGGCFWCLEPVFADLAGVQKVTPGYMGGHIENPSYLQVCQQESGHIEVVQVLFNPEVISYDVLLDVFFAVHDPTTLNRQGADIGPQYASAVFYLSSTQQAFAKQKIRDLETELKKPVVTRLIDGTAHTFWPAEDEHHNYYHRNPSQGYCQVVIRPKHEGFKKQFASYLGQAIR